MPKRLSKQTRLARERFPLAVTEYLVTQGAIAGTFYQFQIETQAGLLYVTPYDTWIATRFEEPDRAELELGNSPYGRLNRHSGKWNFHFSDEELTGTTALRFFAQHLEPLLLTKKELNDGDRARTQI